MTLKKKFDLFLDSNESYRVWLIKWKLFKNFVIYNIQLVRSFLPTLSMHIIVEKFSFLAAFSN